MDYLEQLGRVHEKVGSLATVNWFLSRMGLVDVLERHVPRDDARLRMAP
jgi:hypothetical protein